jgi:hypothetical protein
MEHFRVCAADDGGSAMERIHVETAVANFVPGKPEMGASDARRASSTKFLRIAGDWDGCGTRRRSSNT